MAADGGVSFSVKLLNEVTRPASAIKSSLKEVKRAFEETKSAVEAPAPKRSAMSDWDRAAAKARRSQVADQARQQARISKLNAADQVKAQKAATKQAKVANDNHKKETKRLADFDLAKRQQKADQSHELAGNVGSAAKWGGAAIAGIALAAAAAVGYLALQFTEAAVAAAAFGQRSRQALGLLIDSAGTGAMQFNSLRHEAEGLGLDIERTQMSFQKLLAAQFSIGKSRELIRMGSDLQAIGAKADDVEGVLLAITQIKSKGKLQAEEMLQLQERGISAELVYNALGEKLGKSKDELMAMQKKGKLGGPEAIDAILAAVRKKTNTEFAGQAGEQFAKTTLSGMVGVWKAKGTNFMIDVGDAILPGITKLSSLVSSGLDKLMSDPKLSSIGKFLLSEFEYFTLWAEANWPQITNTLVTGAQAMGDALRLTVELFDTSTVKGMAFVGLMYTLAAVFGIVAVATALLMLPIYLLIGAVGLVAYAIYKAVQWIISSVGSLSSQFTLGSVAAGGKAKQALGIQAAEASSPTITTAADTGPMASVGRSLGAYNPDVVTVQGEPQGPGGTANHFDFSGMQVGANVDQDDLAAKIRSQVTKAISEAA